MRFSARVYFALSSPLVFDPILLLSSGRKQFADVQPWMPLLPDGTTFDVSVLVSPSADNMDKLDCWWDICYYPLAFHLKKFLETGWQA